jgi:hypothetical protein
MRSDQGLQATAYMCLCQALVEAAEAKEERYSTVLSLHT